MTFKDVKIGQRFVFDMDMIHDPGQIFYSFAYEKIKNNKVKTIFVIFNKEIIGTEYLFSDSSAKIGMILP